MYTAGVWVVKKGREEDFVRRWQTSVDQQSLQYPGITFRLLRDVDNPQRFVSVGGAWRSAEQIAVARSDASYQEAMAEVEKLLESGAVSTFELAAEVS